MACSKGAAAQVFGVQVVVPTELVVKPSAWHLKEYCVWQTLVCTANGTMRSLAQLMFAAS